MLKSIETMNLLAKHVSKDNDVLCLLGLGSMDQVERADFYSDIDFFIIVEEAAKPRFLTELSWLEANPVVYSFKNSNDGYKVLYENGVYGEFAIFTPSEIVKAYFTGGLVYYAKEGFDVSLVEPKNSPIKRSVRVDYNVNEALTNLYVGLLRLHRGEVANASTFIQVYSYNLVLPLFEELYKQHDKYEDLYVFERRIEFRYKEAKSIISTFRQGYNKSKESARTILDFLSKHYELNEHMVKRINELL